jgi:phage terminase small subunit
MKGKGLSHSHLIYVTEYLSNGGNQTAAYQIAYGQVDKVKAAISACKLMKRPDIVAHIQEAQEKLINKGLWSSEAILMDIKKIATDETVSKAVRLNAYALGMKLLNIGNESKVEHKGNIDTTNTTTITSMTKEELEAYLGEDSDE